jgi:hypothetical protein
MINIEIKHYAYQARAMGQVFFVNPNTGKTIVQGSEPFRAWKEIHG